VDLQAPEILKKFRVALAEPASKLIDIQTYSSTTDSMSNTTITAVSTDIDAEQTPIDVGGAYWHGKRVSLIDGGRAIFYVVPAWLDGFTGKIFGKTYRTHDRRIHPRRWFIRIKGNMPGRCRSNLASGFRRVPLVMPALSSSFTATLMTPV
jgi:hypothetical protein